MSLLERYWKPAFIAALLFGGLGISLQAQAVAANTQQTFDFAGNCTDCAAAAGGGSYPVTGTLILQNYTPGTDIAFENFLSFSYHGSNLVDPYTVAASVAPDGQDRANGIFSAAFASVAGNVGSTKAAYRFELVFDDGLFFQSQNNGSWSTCAPKGDTYYGGDSCGTFPPVPSDYGATSTYSSAAAIPEPGAWAMLCAGMGLVAFMRRRRS